MNYLGLVAGLAIVGIIVYLMSQKKKRDAKATGGETIHIPGFTKIGYNLNQMSALDAEVLGMTLKRIARKVWRDLQRIYGVDAEMSIKHIIFDKTFTATDGIFTRKIIKLTMPGNTIVMRPLGGGGHSGQYWFALELLNLYRGAVFGIDKIYLDDNAPAEEIAVWLDAQQACKDAVR